MAAKIMARQILGVAFLSLGMAVYAADSLQGTISKVEDEGKAITVKGKDGKETKLKVSSKRTQLEGVKESSELKVGQAVNITHEGGEAKTLSSKADAKADAKAAAKSEPKSKGKSDSKSAESKSAKADAKAESKSGSKTKAESKSDSKTEPGTYK
ncbi:MAG: hypothetical protein H0U63_01500 [Burkholderiales bacterium]|nr:hypothetical protein [Burkholderiales bacterium]